MDFINAFTVSLQAVVDGSGFVGMTSGNVIMIIVGLVLLYLAFARDFEPLLLSPIAFGCILANIPFNGFEEPGVMSAIGLGIKYEIFPPLIFLGVGAMTDFGPLIARPSALLMGAAAQIGVFVASMHRRQAPSASSAVRTARPRSTSRRRWHRISWVRSPLQHTPTWRWFRSFSRRS